MLFVKFRAEEGQAETAEVETYAHFRAVDEALPRSPRRRIARDAAHHRRAAFFFIGTVEHKREDRAGRQAFGGSEIEKIVLRKPLFAFGREGFVSREPCLRARRREISRLAGRFVELY